MIGMTHGGQYAILRSIQEIAQKGNKPTKSKYNQAMDGQSFGIKRDAKEAL